VRDVLTTLGLESWVKTTGGRGLHVVVPIKPGRDWSECLDFARNVSEAIERTDPIYTTTFAKAGRERKILIDFMRNNRTNTSVSAFSPRARPGAMVSMPLAWRELGGGPERWTLLTSPKRLKHLRTDPWAGYWSATQRLSTVSINALARL
jgi:bifunctional non-homologous end joining protein LigD